MGDPDFPEPLPDFSEPFGLPSPAVFAAGPTFVAMNRTHATVIAIIIGLAAVFGLFAATRTAQLGSAARNAASAQIVAEQRRIAAAERSLRRQLAQKPPSAAASAAAPRTVYVRPAPIIVHLHRHGGDDGGGELD